MQMSGKNRVHVTGYLQSVPITCLDVHVPYFFLLHENETLILLQYTRKFYVVTLYIVNRI